MSKKVIKVVTMLLLFNILISCSKAKDNEPVFSVKTVHGAYITGMTDDSVIIMWENDEYSIGKVEYGTGGSFTDTAEEINEGVVQICTRHEVHLTGLKPGTAYNYRTVSTRVGLDQGKAKLGSTVTGPQSSFTTFDSNKTAFSFVFLTDTHDTPNRITKPLELDVIKDKYDFVVDGGDVQSENSIGGMYDDLIDPSVSVFASRIPLFYVHGNHETRGPGSRQVYDYFPTATGQFYYGFKQGKTTFAVLDSGEGSEDTRGEIGGLINSGPYLSEEMKWAKNYFISSDWKNAANKIAFVHIPTFTYGTNTNPEYGVEAWKDQLNKAGTKLVVSGHTHGFKYESPGTDGKLFHHITVGQEQVAKFDINESLVVVTVYNIKGGVVQKIVIN